MDGLTRTIAIMSSLAQVPSPTLIFGAPLQLCYCSTLLILASQLMSFGLTRNTRCSPYGCFHAFWVRRILIHIKRRCLNFVLFFTVDKGRNRSLPATQSIHQYTGIFWFDILPLGMDTLENTEFSLRDRCILVELDNTSAVSYLLKHRTNSKSLSHCIVRLYSLAIPVFGLIVDQCHLAGALNPRADAMSRIKDPIDFSCFDDFLSSPQASQFQPQLLVDLGKVGRTSKSLSVEASCRALLLKCVVSPLLMPTRQLVGQLMSLASGAGSHFV